MSWCCLRVATHLHAWGYLEYIRRLATLVVDSHEIVAVTPMSYSTPPILISGLVVFASILLLMEIGRRFGERDRKQDPEHAASGTGSVEAAVFGLMGLLIAFTFSGA